MLPSGYLGRLNYKGLYTFRENLDYLPYFFMNFESSTR